MPDDLKAVAAELGLADMPEAERDALLASFGEIALKAATIAVLEKLSPDKREEFTKLAEGGDAAALTAFLDREVPGHKELAAAAVRAELESLTSVTST